MNRLVFIGFLFIFFLCFRNVPLMSAEEDYSDTQKQETKFDIYTQYQNAQEGLWRDYQRLRDEFVNGYLSGRLKMTYEEFKLKGKSLRDRYTEGRKELLNKYFSEMKKI